MITSPQNRKLKEMRRVADCRGEPDRLLLEGPHLILAAVEAGLELEVVLATPHFLGSAAGRRVQSKLPTVVEPTAPHLLEELADTDSPRGLLAIGRRVTVGLETLAQDPRGVVLYLERVQDPGNVGAIARVAEAAGASGLAIGVRSAHAAHPRALRASAGSLLRMPWCRTPLRPLLDHMAAMSPAVVALDPHRGRSLYDEDSLPEGPAVLLLGSEGSGLSAAAEEHAQWRLQIPMRAPVESLNVALSTAIVLYEMARRRRFGAGPIEAH